MTRPTEERSLTRRELLAAGVAGAGILSMGRPAGAAVAPLLGGTIPFKLGLQSYSLRGYTKNGKPDLAKALAITKELNLRFWEAYPAHIPDLGSKEKTLELRKQVQSQGIQIDGYGVVHLGKDEKANRKILDFARTLGVAYLSIDPDPESFTLLDRLVDEYGIALGIHNHGPGHRFAKIDTIAHAIKDHHPKIGCCIDTGHFLRSREDPVRAAEVFKGRTFGVHLKDVKDANTFTILGQGDLRTVELLKVLSANKYEHIVAIEYEENPEDPFADIKACLDATRKAIGAVQVGRARKTLTVE